MPDETAKDVNEKFDQWAVVEVMGHKKYAGRVTEQQIAGAGLVRVDVPESVVEHSKIQYDERGYGTGMTVEKKTIPAFTKLIGPASIYCITPVTEELARKAAARIAYESGDPIPVYIPQERQIPATVPANEEPAAVVVGPDPGGDDDDQDDDDYPF